MVRESRRQRGERIKRESLRYGESPLTPKISRGRCIPKFLKPRPVRRAGLFHFRPQMFRILESHMYRDPMRVLEAKQEAEAREKARDARKKEPSEARKRAEALFSKPE